MTTGVGFNFDWMKKWCDIVKPAKELVFAQAITFDIGIQTTLSTETLPIVQDAVS